MLGTVPPLTSSAQEPQPVRVVAKAIADWVGRLGTVWVEGQVTQLSRRAGTSFLTLRDPVADVSVSVTLPGRLLEQTPVREGDRVAVHARPEVYLTRGSLSLSALEIRAVGVGQLLARIEHLKRVLQAEGLFDPARKRPLPFLPQVVGLVTGRESAALRDVVDNARRRWPAVEFAVEEVAVQGVRAVPEVLDALARLDRRPDVDVIVLARGGGSVEDLLPFSDETLCRAVAACRTPVVSAIGHEPDSPLLDHVADVRCSTPTDAGKRVVPDVAEERQRVQVTRDRGRRAVHGRVQAEQSRLQQVRTRPVLADPRVLLDAPAHQVATLRDRARDLMRRQVADAATALTHHRGHLVALSPQSVLDRGFAVVALPDGTLARDAAEVPPGTPVQLRLAAGRLHAVTTDDPATVAP